MRISARVCQMFLVFNLTKCLTSEAFTFEHGKTVMTAICEKCGREEVPLPLKTSKRRTQRLYGSYIYVRSDESRAPGLTKLTAKHSVANAEDIVSLDRSRRAASNVEPDTGGDSEPGSSERAPETGTETATEPGLDVDSESEPDAGEESEVIIELESEFDAESESEDELEPEIESESEAENYTETDVENNSEPTVEQELESQPGEHNDNEPEAGSTDDPDTEPEGDEAEEHYDNQPEDGDYNEQDGASEPERVGEPGNNQSQNDTEPVSEETNGTYSYHELENNSTWGSSEAVFEPSIDYENGTLPNEISGAAEDDPQDEPSAEPETDPEDEPTDESESKSGGGSESEGESEEEEEAMAEIAETELVLFIVLYSLCIFLIVFGNILVVVIITKDKQLRRNTTNLYLLSLVTARASIGVLVVPARITGLFSESYLGSILCKLCHFAAGGSAAASVFSIVAIAIVRYLEVVHGKDIKNLSMSRSILIVVLIWGLGFVYAIRFGIFNDLFIVRTGMKPTWTCSIHTDYAEINEIFIFVDMLCLFLVPFVIILYCYGMVIRTLGSHGRNTKETSEKRQSFRAIQMLVVLMVLFTICTLSPMVLQIYLTWGGQFSHSTTVEASLYLFSYSNAWFNLVVFAIFRDDLREGFWKLCRQGICCHRREDNTTPVEVFTTKLEEPDRDQRLFAMEF